jgi:hypothetical protein
MKTFILDLQKLIIIHWKTIAIIVIVLYLLYSYADIKQGIMDGWSGR